MTNIETRANRKLNNHLKTNSGTKTVCVSTCLSYLGIDPNTYRNTSSDKNIYAYENVLRSNGYGLRSRITEFKVKKCVTTMTNLRKEIKKSKYTTKDLFIVSGMQSKIAHLMILNGMGEIIIDTAPNKKWRIYKIKQLIK